MSEQSSSGLEEKVGWMDVADQYAQADAAGGSHLTWYRIRIFQVPAGKIAKSYLLLMKWFRATEY